MTNNPQRKLLIAIDGPAGVGKTTIGQMLAEQLNCAYLDTGAMYRAVAWQSLQKGVKVDDVDGLARIARELDFVSRNASPEEASDGRQYTVLLRGQDVSQQLRTPAVEAIVSDVAKIPAVREALVEKQREIAHAAGSLVMIGRDIGSVVLRDNANMKIYLDASPEVRAQRRSQQKKDVSNTATTQQELEKRDRIDSQRETSPLVVAEDAIVINTDNLTQQQVLEAVLHALKTTVE